MSQPAAHLASSCHPCGALGPCHCPSARPRSSSATALLTCLCASTPTVSIARAPVLSLACRYPLVCALSVPARGCSTDRTLWGRCWADGLLLGQALRARRGRRQVETKARG